jgi:hypothetical protein
MALVARYYLNEATSGQNPANALDSAPSPYNLPIIYVGDTPTYITSSHGSGLTFPSGTKHYVGAISPFIAGSKIYSAVNGATNATLEVVVNVNQAMADASYGTDPMQIFGVNRTDGEQDRLSFWWWGNGFWFDAEGAAEYPTDYWYLKVIWSQLSLSVGRFVFHCVFDSTASNADDRMQVYINGTRVTTIYERSNPPQNSTLYTNGSTDHLNLGGFSDYAAGLGGFIDTIWYAALYSDSLSQSTIISQSALLLTNDDPLALEPVSDTNVHGK